ncbi:hypothetical protein V2E29_29615 [Streptomyces diastatochromogenes]|uniref:hypothetical protein n=1 Tax=Streptomyces diastatochromogenes TaxID=42236 RepID=UPI002F26C37F
MQQSQVLADHDVTSPPKAVLKKLPEVTLAFWVMKIAATTLGRPPETSSPRP